MNKISTYIRFTIIAGAIVIAGLTGNLLLAGCSRFDAQEHTFPNAVYLDVSATEQVQPATFSNNLPEVLKEISVTLSYPASEDVTASVAVDESLVARYNAAHGTSYTLVPSQYLDFSRADVTIPAGKTVSEAIPVRLKGLMGEGEEQTGAMTIDETYLLPVRISSSSMKIMESCAIAYYLLKRSSAITVAASLHDNWINFPLLDVPDSPQANAYNGLTAVTYEALIYIDQFDLTNNFGGCNISSVMGVEQYLLMRIGDVNFERQQIQFDGSGSGSSFGKFPSSDPLKKLEEGQWYHVACTYDQASRQVRVYVNGRLQSEGNELGISVQGADNRINLAQRALGSSKAYQFFLAKSYNEYRPLQGKMAEARVWSVARTPEQIWENMYRIRNPKDLPELIGYWKFDEGKGNTVKDYSRYGNDGVAEKDIVWPSGIEIPEINKVEE